MAAAAWCCVCGGPPTCAVTVEVQGTLAHYGACWQHVAQVAARARGLVDAADPVAYLRGPTATPARGPNVVTVAGYIDTSEQAAAEPQLELGLDTDELPDPTSRRRGGGVTFTDEGDE